MLNRKVLLCSLQCKSTFHFQKLRSGTCWHIKKEVVDVLSCQVGFTLHSKASEQEREDVFLKKKQSKKAVRKLLDSVSLLCVPHTNKHSCLFGRRESLHLSDVNSDITLLLLCFCKTSKNKLINQWSASSYSYVNLAGLSL